MTYALILGNTPILSILEAETLLKSSYSSVHTKPLLENILEVDLREDLDAQDLIKNLGGTVKIAKFCCCLASLSNIERVASCLDQGLRKVDFGISLYGDVKEDIKKISGEVKEYFKKKSISSRFVLPKDHEISSVVFEKQKLQELLIVKNKENYSIFSTLFVQDFEGWNFRDYQRPCVDPKRGMLPPKVARMMVNLSITDKNSPGVLLDPFCGVGTILSEAMARGFDVVGSDQSSEAISSTKENLEWMKKSYNISGIFSLYVQDATHISEVLKAGSIDCIVTEPYMGPLIQRIRDKIFIGNKDATPETIGNIIKGLEKLYIGCLKDWNRPLKQGSKVIITFPSYQLDNLELRVNSPIDKISELGYTFCQGPITYSRPQAFVKRNIYIFEKA